MKHRNFYKESKNQRLFVSEDIAQKILNGSCTNLFVDDNEVPFNTTDDLDIFMYHSEPPISAKIHLVQKIYAYDIDFERNHFPNNITKNKIKEKSINTNNKITKIHFSIKKIDDNIVNDNKKTKEKTWKGGIEEKPEWDVLFMSEAFLIAQKSIDPSTVHGSIWVSNNKKILSKGYNGPLRGSNDNEIPLTRPDKYFHFLHSEENCILNYNGSASDTENSTIYVTGRPCHRCLRMIIQKGIKRIVYGPVGSACVDEEDMNAQHIMLKNRDIVIEEFKNIDKVKDLFNRTLSYIQYKITENHDS
jgi:dCMP deaminase